MVRRRPTVADQVYPEILRRILNKPDLQHEDDLKNQIITVYQIIQYHEVGFERYCICSFGLEITGGVT